MAEMSLLQAFHARAKDKVACVHAGHLVSYPTYYWASEASPTLGCSIEISRDICNS